MLLLNTYSNYLDSFICINSRPHITRSNFISSDLNPGVIARIISWSEIGSFGKVIFGSQVSDGVFDRPELMICIPCYDVSFVLSSDSRCIE